MMKVSIEACGTANVGPEVEETLENPIMIFSAAAGRQSDARLMLGEIDWVPKVQGKMLNLSGKKDRADL